MKILFIENKYKTGLWSMLAYYLKKSHHTVEYLVQNPLFFGKHGKNHFIPFPNKNSLALKDIDDLRTIIDADRNINYFGVNKTEYFSYYFQKISQLLDIIKPDLIIGETALFHELLTIKAARHRNIIYINPSTCRYPTGRFSFYKYDTLEPYIGSNEKLSSTKALEILKGIKERSILPDYMKSTFKTRKNILFNIQHYKFKLFNPIIMTSSWIIGERYNTPSPWKKIQLERQKKNNVKLWDLTAERKKKKIIKEAFVVLYPLQMQPEANIDVWGNKYRNQTKLIMNIHKQLNSNEILIVKANPKSKYELETELIDFIKSKDNIYISTVSTKMEELLPFTDLIITVSGTISMEAPLMDIPVISLIPSYMNNFSSSIFLNDISKLREVISRIKNEPFKTISLQEKILYINYLNSISFQGKWSAPFLNKSVKEASNVYCLLSSLNSLFNSINSKKE